ncbi:MAG: hypothetical protein KatS3mg068_0543 [Candidatus Sericytochromatia bacterium]|nr:MAG: hypothetical protein KatS3mg068_0543 [Candidatus Sericytochromatia bacterium]
MIKRLLLIVIFTIFISFKAIAQEDISILHINDANGNINPIKVDGKFSAGGILQLADFVRSFNKSQKNTIFVSSSDMIAPMPESSKNKGRIYIDFFNKVGLDIWSPGDYDFLYGLDNLKEITKNANFNIINTNLVYKHTKKNIFKPYVIIEKLNKKFLFLGVTNLNSYEQLPDDVKNNIQIIKPIDAINEALNNIDENYDFVILLAQLNNEEKVEIMKKTKVDLIIGSIGRIVESDIMTFSTFNNKYSVITSGYTISVGQVDLSINNNKVFVKNLKNNLLLEKDDYQEDILDIKEIIRKYKDDSDKVTLAKFSSSPNRQQSYQFINTSIHRLCNCEITIFPNNFFMRGYYFEQEINEHDIFSVIPVPSKLKKIKINGYDLKNFIKSIELNDFTISGYLNNKVNNVPISNNENYILCTTEQTYRKNPILKEQKDVYTTSESINQLLYKYILDNKGKVFDLSKEEKFDDWKIIFKLDLDPQFLNVDLKKDTDYNYLVWKGDKNALSWGGVSNLFIRRYWDDYEFDNRITLEFRQQQTGSTAIEKFADTIQYNSFFKKRFFNSIIIPFTETKISSFFINPKPEKPHQILLELNTGLLHELPFGFKFREGLEIRKNLLDTTLDWQFGGFISLNFINNIFFLKEEFEGKLYLPVGGRLFITEIQNKITYPISNLFNLYYQINLYNETFDFSKMAIRQNAGIGIKLDNPFIF